MCNYFQRFKEWYSPRTNPLYELLKKDVEWKWGARQQLAFDEMKVFLTNEPFLRHPDFEKTFLVTVNSSPCGIGAVLTQLDDTGVEGPIAYGSRTLTGAETRYTVEERECLAVVFALNHFRPYLYGKQFELFTESSAAAWLQDCTEYTTRKAHLKNKITEYDFVVHHRTAKTKQVAKALAYSPVDPPTTDTEAQYTAMPCKKVPLPTRPRAKTVSDPTDPIT